MDGFTIPDLGTAGAIAAIVIAFTLIGLVKGMVRMFFGLVSLAAGGIAAYWGFQRGDAIAGYMISKPDPWMAGAVGVLMGLAVFFTARAIFGMVAGPTKVVDGKKQISPGPGALLGIIGGLAFCCFLISGLRYLGTLTELDWLKQCLAEEGKITQLPQPALVSLRNTVDATPPGKFHREHDRLNNPERAQLARLKVLTKNNYATRVASGNAAVMAAFNQPEIRKFLETTPELLTYIQDDQFSHLLANKKVRELSAVPAVRETLAPIELPLALGIQPVPAPKKKTKPKEKK